MMFSSAHPGNRATWIWGLAIAVSLTSQASTQAAAPSPVQDRTIGYVLTKQYWAVQAGDEKKECPDGFNEGPREQYDAQFPKISRQRTVLETELKREADIWFPTAAPDQFAYKVQMGTTAPGLNLDGKKGPHDYTSPDGEKGVDNEFSRVQGCISGMRPGPDSFSYFYNNRGTRQEAYGRLLIEITNVDDLTNDDDITVNLYRGLEPLRTDSTAAVDLPYATQRIDTRWGKKITRVLRGRIANGVLITEPTDITLPEPYYNSSRTEVFMRDGRFRLNLSPTAATGLLGGYVDIPSWHLNVQRGYGVYLLGHDPQSSASVYKAMMKYADAYPDAAGHNTAISAAKNLTFTQVFVQHSPAFECQSTASNVDPLTACKLRDGAARVAQSKGH